PSLQVVLLRILDDAYDGEAVVAVGQMLSQRVARAEVKPRHGVVDDGHGLGVDGVAFVKITTGQHRYTYDLAIVWAHLVEGAVGVILASRRKAFHLQAAGIGVGAAEETIFGDGGAPDSGKRIETLDEPYGGG